MKKTIALVLIIILGLSLFTGCSTKNNSNVIGDINFEVVGSGALTSSKLEEWYNESFKSEGISSFDSKEYKYILIGAGEKPTGGYSVEVTSVEGNEDSITVTARVNAPKPDEMVTQAISYPSALIRVSKDSRKVELGELKKDEAIEGSYDAIEGTGTFVGLADSNSCEIIVDGEATPFRLAEEVKDAVSKIEMNQKIKFSYYINEYEQMVIVEIEKLEE
ncbi:MAG: protease complex subunit PrcB family protein [Tissierellales bacterium]